MSGLRAPQSVQVITPRTVVRCERTDAAAGRGPRPTQSLSSATMTRQPHPPTTRTSGATGNGGGASAEVHQDDDKDAAGRLAPREAAGGRLGPVIQFVRGFTMGSADLVPGVSGGTMALVFGIYDPLVQVIRDAAASGARLVTGDLRGALGGLRRLSWRFLVPLVAGIVAAVIVLAGPLSLALERYPILMSAAFFGLIVGSVVVTIPVVDRWDARRLSVLAAVAGATFALLGLRGPGVADPGLLVLFAGGAVAVWAMILPGISGSLILVIIGLYDAVLTAAHDREVAALAVFALGATGGLALFSTALNWLLANYRDTVMAGLIGLMIGSLRVLWMWPAGDGVDDVRLGAPVAADVPGALLVLVAAGVAVIAVARIGRAGTRS